MKGVNCSMPTRSTLALNDSSAAFCTVLDDVFVADGFALLDHWRQRDARAASPRAAPSRGPAGPTAPRRSRPARRCGPRLPSCSCAGSAICAARLAGFEECRCAAGRSPCADRWRRRRIRAAACGCRSCAPRPCAGRSSIERVTMPASMASPSGIFSRSMIARTRSPAKMRISGSSSDR